MEHNSWLITRYKDVTAKFYSPSPDHKQSGWYNNFMDHQVFALRRLLRWLGLGMTMHEDDKMCSVLRQGGVEVVPGATPPKPDDPGSGEGPKSN